MLSALQAMFWLSLVVVIYTYVGYPIAIYFLSRWFGRVPKAEECGDDRLPRLSLLIAAYNERGVMAERIENALAMDYPRERLEIVIASDGSNDGTNEIVKRYADRGVRLLAHPHRRGKSVVLNEAMPQLRGEVVLLSDANTMLEPSAGRRLVRWFADSDVGAVCGWLRLVDSRTSHNVDGVYWRYENFLKRCEGRLGALLGANGAIYAVRRSAYHPIPSNTLVDDLTIPLLARLRSGCRIIYDKQAVAWEETAPDIHAEFRRRARIGAGGFQAISRLWPLLHPRFGWTAFSFLSHKVLRWYSPFLLVIAFVTSLLLANQSLYFVLFLLQVLFYSAALLGVQVTHQGRVARLLRMPALFTTVNLALMVGFWRWLSQEQSGPWIRTSREPIGVQLQNAGAKG